MNNVEDINVSIFMFLYEIGDCFEIGNNWIVFIFGLIGVLCWLIFSFGTIFNILVFVWRFIV